MKARILIIEDETELAEWMQIYLNGEGISLEIAVTAEAGLAPLGAGELDLVLLDINLMGLGVGADEFVTKPFKPHVLMARVRALLRRTRNEGRHIVSFGPFVLDAAGFFLSREGKRIELSSNEIEEDPANPIYVQTIHGKGYRFNPECITDDTGPT